MDCAPRLREECNNASQSPIGLTGKQQKQRINKVPMALTGSETPTIMHTTQDMTSPTTRPPHLKVHMADTKTQTVDQGLKEIKIDERNDTQKVKKRTIRKLHGLGENLNLE